MSSMKIYKGDSVTEFLDRFEARRSEDVSGVERTVTDILKNVKADGDKALESYAKKFDGVDLDTLGIQIPVEEIEKAYQNLDSDLKEVLAVSKENIKKFHSKGLPQSWLSWEEDEVVLGQRIMPLERVGVYVPGGRAAYPSSLLMGVVPAQVAGVKEIVIVTPSDAEGNVNRTILAAAYILGIDKVFRVGGAHAIAALAYGTETVPRVDKIVGPGNIYVATAKKLIFGQCGIDSVAGPSEVVVIADDSAEPDYIAADLLAQAEHDPLASSILLTDSQELADKVVAEFAIQLKTLSRHEIINESCSNYGGIIVADTMEKAIEICNQLAPEHLGLHAKDSWDMLGKIKNAGAIFLGSYSPETVGDYWAGPNHILPTNGSARFFSPLRTEDFLKTSSIISFSQKAMKKDADKITKFARSEGLDAHANAITQRIKK
jgi:histidinol dehydrogenase